MNDGISEAVSSLTHVGIQDAVKVISTNGKGDDTGEGGHKERIQKCPGPPSRQMADGHEVERCLVCRHSSAFWPSLCSQNIHSNS